MFIPNHSVATTKTENRDNFQQLVLQAEKTQANASEASKFLNSMKGETIKFEREMENLDTLNKFLQTSLKSSTHTHRNNQFKKMTSTVKSILNNEEWPATQRVEAHEDAFTTYKKLDELFEQINNLRVEDEESGYTSCSSVSQQSPRNDAPSLLLEEALISPPQQSVCDSIYQDKILNDYFSDDMVLENGEVIDPLAYTSKYVTTIADYFNNKNSLGDQKKVNNKSKIDRNNNTYGGRAKTSLSSDNKVTKLPDRMQKVIDSKSKSTWKLKIARDAGSLSHLKTDTKPLEKHPIRHATTSKKQVSEKTETKTSKKSSVGDKPTNHRTSAEASGQFAGKAKGRGSSKVSSQVNKDRRSSITPSRLK